MNKPLTAVLLATSKGTRIYLNLIIQEKGKVAIDKINNYIEIQGVNNIEQLIEVNKLYENT